MKEVLIGLAAAGILFGVFLGWIGWTLKEGEDRYRNWEMVNASIIESELNKRLDPSLTTGASNLPKQMYWFADISYEYEVGGHKYVGSRFANSEAQYQVKNDEPPDELLERLREHPVGSKTTIRVHPTQPEQSFIRLIYGGGMSFLYGAAFCGIIGLIATGLLFQRVFTTH